MLHKEISYSLSLLRALVPLGIVIYGMLQKWDIGKMAAVLSVALVLLMAVPQLFSWVFRRKRHQGP
jgi:TRAP-type uncharacterized transport system fused permease subunit